jgi:hypothetical protein
MNLVKRIERLPKPRRSADALQPLFEAVSNSIQSTREKFKGQVGSRGIIRIEVVTERKAGFISASVEDNGVGLDRRHYQAFLETDTDNKLQIGGKGVGRLLWLDCFDRIRIESRYKDGPGIKFRTFDFKLAPVDQIKNPKHGKASGSDTGMSVNFSGLRDNGYKSKFPGRSKYVAQHFISHFLPLFIGRECPRITLHCGETYEFPEAIDNIVLRREDVKKIGSKRFGNFALTMMECDKIASSDLKGTHFVHFIAHDRTVHSQAIDGKLGFKHFGGSGKSVFHACIFGEFLDKNVNQERTGFTFEDSVLEEIVNEACMPKIEAFLSEALASHSKEQQKIIGKVVSAYPSVEFGSSKELQKIVPLGELNGDAIYGHLARERFRRDQRQANEIRAVLRKIESPDVPPDSFYDTIKRTVNAIERAEQKSLAEYIIRRKVVLDFLEVLLRTVRQNAGDSSYQREHVLHSFICPLKVRTVGGVRKISAASSHELWVVDERLTYTQYFSSDISFSELSKKYDSNERPDILIFDRVHGLRQSDIPSKVLLVEFKRPGRTNYESNENPHFQIERYIKQLLAGDEVDVNGRPIRLGSDTVFYCYIVADRVGRMVEWTYSWSQTADGRGRVLHAHDGFKGSIELIEWDSLLADARDRNRAFFEYAGIQDVNLLEL